MIRRLLRRLSGAQPSDPWRAQLVHDFVYGGHGAAYGFTKEEARALVADFEAIQRSVESGTSMSVHLALARALLDIPPSVEGDVVECGCWKGASSCSLSRVCQRIGRRLLVCDSFQGLPDDGTKRHVGMHTGVYGHYREGMFAATLQEVRDNVARFGAPDVCEFVPGFFQDSLAQLHRPVAFAFLDVDLEQSTRDCLLHLWPRLVEGGYLFADDAGDLEVVKVYFDEPWWREHLGQSAPGFVGSGCGLPLSPKYSSIGYTRKLGAFDPAQWQRMPFLHYPE